MKQNLTYKTPIYVQLREVIRGRIEVGEYPAGTAIPTEKELAETYGINRFTVRSAVDALVKEGMLKRIQGKGVFVVGATAADAVIERYDGYNLGVSLNSDSLKSKFHAKSARPAGDKFAGIFSMPAEDRVFHVKHLKCRGDETIAFQEDFLPYAVLPALEQADLAVFTLEAVMGFYGVGAYTIRQSLEIIRGSERVRHILDDMPEDVAIMLLTCVYEDQRGATIRYQKNYIRSDKFRFLVSLHS